MYEVTYNCMIQAFSCSIKPGWTRAKHKYPAPICIPTPASLGRGMLWDQPLNEPLPACMIWGFIRAA